MVGAAVPLAWPRPAAEAIARRGFRVTNFDCGPPPGWKGDPIQRTCIEQINDVLAVMDHVGIAKAHLIGLSRGAITAYGMASRFPERVGKLVLAFPVAGFADTIRIVADGGDGGEADLGPLEILDRALDTTFSEEFLRIDRQRCRDLFLSPAGTVIRVERFEETPLDPFETVAAPTLMSVAGEIKS